MEEKKARAGGGGGGRGRWEGERKEANAPVFYLLPSSSALFLFFEMQRRPTWESSYIRKKIENL